MAASSGSTERKIHVRMDEELHRCLRIRCAELDTTIQDFVVGLIEREVRPTPDRRPRANASQRRTKERRDA